MTDVRPEAVFIEQGTEAALDNSVDIESIKNSLTAINAALGEVLNMDFTTTANVIYTQIKVSDSVNYIKKMDTVNGTLTFSPNNTAWANRASATYTTRAV